MGYQTARDKYRAIHDDSCSASVSPLTPAAPFGLGLDGAALLGESGAMKGLAALGDSGGGKRLAGVVLSAVALS
jgi:hypothetical protein